MYILSTQFQAVAKRNTATFIYEPKILNFMNMLKIVLVGPLIVDPGLLCTDMLPTFLKLASKLRSYGGEYTRLKIWPLPWVPAFHQKFGHGSCLFGQMLTQNQGQNPAELSLINEICEAERKW